MDPYKVGSLRIVLLLAVALVAACHRSPAARKASGGDLKDSLLSVAPADSGRLPVPWTINKRSASAAVYLDASKSMGGYSTSAPSGLRQLVNNLEREALATGVTRFETAFFSTDAGPLSPAISMTEVLNAKFDAGSTCLAAPWRAPGPGIRFVLTDGVPSAVDSLARSGSCSCPASDPTNVNCIARALVEFIQAGNGIWLIGLRSSFTGTYYPEMPPRVAFAPRSPVLRPLYAWIGASDVEQGRQIARETFYSLQKAGAEAFLLEIWPGRWMGAKPNAPTSGNLQLVGAEASRKCGTERTRAKVIRIEGNGIVRLARTPAPQLLIGIRLPVDTGAVVHRDSIPQLVIAAPSSEVIVTGARPIWWTADSLGGCFELSSDPLVSWMRGVRVEPGQIQYDDWSTGNDSKRENLGKTLFLSELLDALAHLLASTPVAPSVTLLRATLQ